VSAREGLLTIYRAALDAVRAGPAVVRALSASPYRPGTCFVLSVGKAACAMAEGAREVLGDRIVEGRVYTGDAQARDVDGMSVRTASHPIPDVRSTEAAAGALAFADALGPEDALLVLISGGASALWVAPVAGVTFEEKRRVNELLISGGVDIEGINAVRKHLSRIKGGGLARHAAPVRLLTLAVSDVRGDRGDTIGSGPTVGDPTTFDDALSVLRRAELIDGVPKAVRRHLEEGARGCSDETLKPWDELAGRGEFRLVAVLDDALNEAVRVAEREGHRVWKLGASLYGEAREEGRSLAARLAQARARGVDLIVAGGEPTVRVRGSGRGGRAQETALAFALAAEGEAVTALFAGTDGADGPTDAAGALVDGETVRRARDLGLDAMEHLDRNDSYPLFDRLGDHVRTGPTDTNVTDLALIRLL
jgi:glycerate-2-kinase